LVTSPSITTRPKRINEANGKEYFFVDDRTFMDAVIEDDLLNNASYGGYRYGLLKSRAEQVCANKPNSSFASVLTLEGIEDVRQHFERVLAIYVLPPSFEVLRKRYLERPGSSLEGFDRRLVSDFSNIDKIQTADYIVINEELIPCVSRISEFLQHNL
jgi:guanylate kinase